VHEQLDCRLLSLTMWATASASVRADTLRSVPYIAALLLKKQLRGRMSKMRDSEVAATPELGGSHANGHASAVSIYDASNAPLVSSLIPVISNAVAADLQRCKQQYALVRC